MARSRTNLKNIRNNSINDSLIHKSHLKVEDNGVISRQPEKCRARSV